MTYFFAQSCPDIRAKLKNLEKGPLTPQDEALRVAFKVYHGRDGQTLKNRYQMLAEAVRPASASARDPLPSGARVPQRPCFKCGQKGHWARGCPNPRAPRKPCPRCQEVGHWSVDCPRVPGDKRTSNTGGLPVDLLALAIDEDYE
ncbi:HERV-F(c)1_Xq21.33 provirus ancestral Gag polyprotein [Cricetulus griseus]|uniref:HERV-F(C)1_Xq21.33 provirus ancestral Gag polyprotein n=1 Tax=Cricetulus griseus TaxID=10029 RepID=G3I1L5_CRIGR|nr:HERV-F(c)1_Xq21.33 provirus ancestral Gag polyprotein [Cricetulus griseus]